MDLKTAFLNGDLDEEIYRVTKGLKRKLVDKSYRGMRLKPIK